MRNDISEFGRIDRNVFTTKAIIVITVINNLCIVFILKPDV